MPSFRIPLIWFLCFLLAPTFHRHTRVTTGLTNVHRNYHCPKFRAITFFFHFFKTKVSNFIGIGNYTKRQLLQWKTYSITAIDTVYGLDGFGVRIPAEAGGLLFSKILQKGFGACVFNM